MILVDTSIWVDHLRAGDAGLHRLLDQGLVAIHPLVIEEIACGRLSKREEILSLLEALPALPDADHSELLTFISIEELFGRGLGAVDVRLLASARLGHARLWTRDKRLAEAATRLGAGYVSS